MKPKQLWTPAIDYLGGSYIRQYEADNIAEAMLAFAPSSDQPFTKVQDVDGDWRPVPVEATKSVFGCPEMSGV